MLFCEDTSDHLLREKKNDLLLLLLPLSPIIHKFIAAFVQRRATLPKSVEISSIESSTKDWPITVLGRPPANVGETKDEFPILDWNQPASPGSDPDDILFSEEEEEEVAAFCSDCYRDNKPKPSTSASADADDLARTVDDHPLETNP